MTLPRVRKAAPFGVALLVAAYAVFLLHYNCYFAAGPDSSGYLNEAKLIASGRMTYDLTPLHERLGLPIDMSYTMTPLGFVPSRLPHRMAPSYPAGVPFHQALFAMVGGWNRAPYLVSPLLAVLAFFATYGVGRQLDLERGYAIGAAAMVVTIPVFIDHAVQPVSDSVATFYALVMLWCALRQGRADDAVHPGVTGGVTDADAHPSPVDEVRRPPRNDAHIRIASALAAGFFFSVAVWIRPTNFLLALPLFFALRADMRRLLLAAAGALPLGIALSWWNHALYGNALRTGYGSVIDVLVRRPVCASFHLRMLGEMVTPIVAIASLYVLFERRLDLWKRAMILSWIAVLFVFYSFYPVCDEWFSIRFLLPGMPAIVFGFVTALRRGAELLQRWSGIMAARLVASIVVIALVSFEIGAAFRFGFQGHRQTDAVFPETIAWAEPRIPNDAVVLCGLMCGPFLFYADRPTLRWGEVLIDGRLALLRDSAKNKRLRWYALLSAVETTPEQFEAWKPAKWSAVGSNRDVTLWKLEE